MLNDLVAYSRAGDVFHYRWAARRCLRLIYPNPLTNSIHIEGSAEAMKEGEYVIDVSEYGVNANKRNTIDYYQLKHSTVQLNVPFTLSDLKDTFQGFAKRYLQHKKEKTFQTADISFTIITNRKIADSFRANIKAITQKKNENAQFKTTLKGYTKLTDTDLRLFCKALVLEDGEGDYNVQKDDLRTELAQLLAGAVDNSQLDSLEALVKEKVLTPTDNRINREQVLSRLFITSERQLFPAPAKWEKIDNVLEREQYKTLIKSINNSNHPLIIHAAGGVGKSIFSQHLMNTLADGSLAIAYDCFGAGSYRNPSETRHTSKDALVQIVNELAAKGFCNPLVPVGLPSEKELTRKFLVEMETATRSLKKVYADAKLYILIDAADNAEMAANELAQACFAHGLLKEALPADCKLILLCRTERIELLQPQSYTPLYELHPFSEKETLANLRRWFPNASEIEGAEFHRLTSNNPRVQANALDAKYTDINSLLASLGHLGTTVENQIALQLKSAIAKINDLLPSTQQLHIQSICLGLASLPPHIPIEVLSKVSGVSFEHVKSFVSDIGRSLWISDTAIQFRDEPTETWFRNTYLAGPEKYADYVAILEPFANQLSYIAEVLPQLYLRANQYSKLIDIALSDKYLPENNPIDARNVQVYRLQFAFKAALRVENYKDAVKLAMRAGEEMAGNLRQLSLFQSNIDLLAALQSKEKVQEIAFKRTLSGTWDGSENIYSAALLSSIKDYRGESQGFLRAAKSWLNIQFDKQRKSTDKYQYRDDGVGDDDILELTFAYLNIYGVQESADFLFGMKPKQAVSRIVKRLTRRLIDAGRFDEIKALISFSNNEPYYIVPIVDELLDVGRFPELYEIEKCLNLLCLSKSRIERPNDTYNDQIRPSIISFLEVCLRIGLPTQKILKALNYYIPIRANQMVYSSYSLNERTVFLKSLAIRSAISGKYEIDIGAISPSILNSKKKDYELEKDKNEFKEIIDGLFPWFSLRVKILLKQDMDVLGAAKSVNQVSIKARTARYRNHDTLPGEITNICVAIMIINHQSPQKDIAEFYQIFLQNNKSFDLNSQLDLVRSAYRAPHLANLSQQMEVAVHKIIKIHDSESPDQIAIRYISLSRAVLVSSREDASVYFNEAIAIVSKFGDEIGERWKSIVALAKKTSETDTNLDELAYRFIRCAETVGVTVADEDHWNRSEAISVCTKMSAGIAISALSRWRDRDIGWLQYELADFLIELVKANRITPTVGWALTSFYFRHELNHILSVCLENENSASTKEKLLADAVSMLQKEGSSPDYWNSLSEIASTYSINNTALQSITNFYFKHTVPKEEEDRYLNREILEQKLPNDKWDVVFADLEIYTQVGFDTLIKRFKEKEKDSEPHSDKRGLLSEALSRFEEKYIWNFVELVLQSDYFDHYDLQSIFNCIPKTWKNRVSYRTRLAEIINRIAEKYAHEYLSSYSYNSLITNLNLDNSEINKFRSGILAGLANGNEFANANTFFDFACFALPYLTNQDSLDLLDFSLSRLEIHIENDFGDGLWRDALHVSNNINENIAGFIWCALGSPHTDVRWNAAHCIRKLAECSCKDMIDFLVYWLEHDKVEAYGHAQYHFYNLHARQNLLMAFARISLEKPELLIKHSNLLLKYVLKQDHALIQKFAKDIILNIEKGIPGTYKKEDLASVEGIGKSKFPIQEQDYNYRIDSYLHKNGEVKAKPDFSFGWDFDRYWYKPLGDVFGVSSDQIQELAANVIIDEWGLGHLNGYQNDPRVALWKQSSEERETWHDHGNYPRVERLDFYLSYHAMFVVAARLLENMPVIHSRSWSEDNPWTYWLSGHSLTRDDGKWLADNKDPLPLNRPLWLWQANNKSWQTDIKDSDFFDAIQMIDGNDQWINVEGHWNENSKDRIECYFISTAFVSPKGSDALLRTLSAITNPYDYKLPYFEEHDAEVRTGNLQLIGWINDRSTSMGRDEFDPYADNMSYPNYTVAAQIVENLGIISDADGENWINALSGEKVIISEMWSSKKEGRDEEPSQSGARIRVKLSLLKQLCAKLGYELIFDVSVKRDVNSRYERDKREYSSPIHKIYILSSDGKLRSTNSNHQFR